MTLPPLAPTGNSSPLEAATGKSVRDAGIVTVSQRKRQMEEAGEEDGAHRYPKKGGMSALNDLAANFGAYLAHVAKKEERAEEKENLNSMKDIAKLKELSALRDKADNPREKDLYTKKISKILEAMDSDQDSN